MMEITIQVPDALGKDLQRFHDRLPDVLERGLRELLVEDAVNFHDESQIIELLTSQPAPEEVLALRPSPEFQARVSELLDYNKREELSIAEANELERYLMLEHLVRLAKAYAYKQLTKQA